MSQRRVFGREPLHLNNGGGESVSKSDGNQINLEPALQTRGAAEIQWKRCSGSKWREGWLFAFASTRNGSCSGKHSHPVEFSKDTALPSTRAERKRSEQGAYAGNMNLSAVLRRVWGCNESSCRCSSTVFCKTGTKKRIPHRRQVLADSRTHPEMIDDQHIRGANLCSWRHNRNKSRSSQNSRKIGPAAMVLALVLTLSGDLSSFGPTSVHGGSAAGTPGTITPAWEWGAQELYECAIPNRNLETQCECYSYNLNDNPPCLSNKPAEPEKRTMAVKKSVPRACTHAPGVQFRCMEPDNPDKDLECLCQKKCLDFNTGWDSKVQLKASPQCMDSIMGLEDTWTALNFYFLHRDPKQEDRVGDCLLADFEKECSEDLKASLTQAVECKNPNPASAEKLVHFFWIQISASFGSFNVYDMRSKCIWVVTESFQICTFSRIDINTASAPKRPEKKLSFLKFTVNMATGSQSIEMKGTFRAIHTALKFSMYYKPTANQNSQRLRNRIYNTASSRTNPYEELVTSLSVQEDCKVDGDYRFLANNTQLLHIVDVNDTPQLSHPREIYKFPFTCTPTAIDPACHFGQFFSFEDTSAAVSIGGIEIFDIDYKEGCPYDNQECDKIDVSARASKGSVQLNTRSRLSFYENTRGAQGFTAFISPSNAAVKVVLYRVETLELLGPKSSVLNFNTQHQGKSEFVTVTVSDQGLSGAAGVAKVNAIQIDVVIVAVNDAPVISIDRLEYSMFEDVSTNLGGGVTLNDPDVNEEIDSPLARITWMAPLATQETLNQIQCSLSVLRGNLRMEYLRNLRLVNVRTTSFYTIKGYRYGHDTCRVRNLVYDEGALAAAASELFGPAAATKYPTTKGVPPLYQGVCVFLNIGSQTCPTGQESTCTCFGDFATCKPVDSFMTLYVNNTSPPLSGKDKLGRVVEDESKRSDWLKILSNAIEMQDRTCGGRPFFEAPNNFSQGLKCKSDDDCNPRVLVTCTPGVNCTCCANATHVCSVDTECFQFEKGSACGCVLDTNTEVGPEHGLCGPYCSDQASLNLVKQGSFTAARVLTNCQTDLNKFSTNPKPAFGRPCTYRGPYPNELLKGATTPAVRRCLPAALGIIGSQAAKVLDTIGMLSPGTSRITLISTLTDIQRALDGTYYLTNLNYNRLFRPPENEIDRATFDIEADNVDTLTVVANDLGNSGGGTEDVKSTQKSVNIRVAAVNDKPVCNGPSSISVYEDIPFHFQERTQTQLNVSDPDYKDYGFALKIFTVNLSCTNGRLFLNEAFLSQPGVAMNRITFREWTSEPRFQKRGIHFCDRLSCRAVYGNGCQLKAQCSDNDEMVSTDEPYGFFESEMHGLVYSPQSAGEPARACGVCPEDTGNKFLSFEGSFEDVNRVLSFVTYLPDPHFNTRSGKLEKIVFEVNDNGGIGNDVTAPALTNFLEIAVLVESVNDRPIIGRKEKVTRPKKFYTGGADLPLLVPDTGIYKHNKTLDGLCFSIPPSGGEYSTVCGATTRQFIDIDEDTEFIISPSMLWIKDVDAQEAQAMQASRRYCCAQAGPVGCKCDKPCLCDMGKRCICDRPSICNAGTDGSSVVPGQLRVHFSVSHGTLNFYPPPGRDFFKVQDLVFLRNVTDTDMTKGGQMVPCEKQIECMRDVQSINLATRELSLQMGIEQFFLTYKGLPNYFGPDVLKIWVSDQGYTDECYNASLVARAEINIRVIGINDSPVIRAPTEVLVFTRGLRCFNSFMEHNTDNGINRECYNTPNASTIPPSIPDRFLKFSDEDVDHTPYGNMTVTIRLGNDEIAHATVGEFQITKVNANSKNWLDLYRDPLTKLATLQILGNVKDMNFLMENLRYDADPTYQGYIPIRVWANDQKNFGECDGKHKCGAEDPCANYKEATPHRPVAYGLTDVILSVTIGAVVACPAVPCEQCVALKGCGFCPGVCHKTGGKCMVGSKSGPTYEICDAHPQDGRTWNMCAKVSDTPWALYGGIAGGFFVSFIVSYLFVQWVRRRHGSIKIYMRKKQADIQRAGRKAKLLPPDEANYNMFFFLVITAAIILIIFSSMSSVRPACQFNSKAIIDVSSTVHIETDACLIRFVSTRNASFPDNMLEYLKLNIATPLENDVVVSRDTCGIAASVSVINQRDEAVKYVNYWCSIEVLVPDRFIMPEMTIVAKGSNITYVRAGDMDPDSYKFGLRFGPNSFNLKGNFLVARLQNITATHIQYNVIKGGLKGVNIHSSTAEFRSEDADMVVTTTTQTSVKFWQKSDNLVCLTAANNSLFVDDACARICKYKLSGSRRSFKEAEQDQRRARGGGADRFSEDAEEVQIVNSSDVSLRQTVLPWLCKDNGDGTQNCSIYDPVQAEIDDRCPVGAQYKKKSQVPQVWGCFDLKFCSSDESPQCLCKPKCDMANLDPPGTCDSFGKCCQTICAGYSKADMFPLVDMPRCGLDVNPAYLWCNGTLDQRWNFTSTSGQISLAVQNMPVAQVSSYKGAAPKEDVSVKIDVQVADKKVLSESFHPGGKDSPNNEWYALRLLGPGTPEASDGEFVWLSSTRYLILPYWMLSIFSMGLLKPSKGASYLNLNPSFCPAYTPASSPLFIERAVLMRQLLLDTIEKYPGPDKKAIPSASLLSYVVAGGSPMIFQVDTATNKMGVALASSSDYPLLVAVIGLAIAFPMIITTALMIIFIFAGYKTVKAYRTQKLKEEYMVENLHQVFSRMEALEKDDDDMNANFEKQVAMVGRTNFFWLFEDFVLSSAGMVRSFWQDYLVVFYELAIVMTPMILVYLMVDLLQKDYQANRCEFRPDECNCYGETDLLLLIVGAVKAILYAFFFVSVLEMGVHVLFLPYSVFRKIIRLGFYLLLYVVVWMTMVLVLIVVLFILLGVLIKPTHLVPYCIAILGTFSCCVAIFTKQHKFQTRVKRAVAKKIDLEKSKMHSVPPILLEVVINKNLQSTLHERGLSMSRIFISTLFLGLSMVVVYAFLFIGFNAFTDKNDMTSGFVNSGIAFGLAIGVHYAFCKEGDEEDVKHTVDQQQEEVMEALKKIFEMVERQLQLAMKLFKKMKTAAVDDVALGEDPASDGGDDADSDQKN